MTNIDTLRYPIGPFETPANHTPAMLAGWINDIEAFPTELTALVENLTDEQLALQYRPSGWTIRQVVHHCADSHMNALVRTKLALTETMPTIKPYEEALWAELPDTLKLPLQPSLQILAGIHTRWVALLRNLDEAQWQKAGYFHPEHNRQFLLPAIVANYAWHGKHHLGHVKLAIARVE